VPARLYCVTSQKAVIFKIRNVRTSDITFITLFTRARYWLYPSHALPSCISDTQHNMSRMMMHLRDSHKYFSTLVSVLICCCQYHSGTDYLLSCTVSCSSSGGTVLSDPPTPPPVKFLRFSHLLWLCVTYADETTPMTDLRTSHISIMTAAVTNKLSSWCRICHQKMIVV
jgi:hypothetical protein